MKAVMMILVLVSLGLPPRGLAAAAAPSRPEQDSAQGPWPTSGQKCHTSTGAGGTLRQADESLRRN